MNPRFSTHKLPSQTGMGDLQIRGKREQDYLSILLWLSLVAFALQAIYVSLISALAWVALGAGMLIIKRGLPIRLLLLVEAPVFFGIICFSVTTIYLALEEGTYDIVHSNEVIDVMWLAWWGMVMFSLGSILILKWFDLPFFKERRAIPISAKQGIWITTFGFICNEVLVHYVPYSVWNAFFVFGYCAPIGLFLIFKIRSETHPEWIRTWKFTLWLSMLLLWALHSVTGGIFGSTLLIMLLFSSEYTQRSKVVLVGFILLAVIIAPLLQDSKSDYRKRMVEDVSRREQKLFDVFAENFKKVFIEGESGAYRQGMLSLASRLCTFDIWLQVKRHMDAHRDFADGQTIKDSLLNSFIPRIVWPLIFNGDEKPKMGGSSDLVKKYADMPVADGTSVGVGAISEFYINGGTGTLLLGMFLLGSIGGLILYFGINDRVQPLGLGMCIVAFSSFVRPEMNLSDMLGAAIRSAFLWWALRAWIIFEYNRSQPLMPFRQKRV
jgi:hypothetical protein